MDQEMSNSVHDNGGTTAFTVGQLVQVDRRAWPGINQPGGVGHIVEIAAAAPTKQEAPDPNSSNKTATTTATNNSNLILTVRYVLDNRYERNINSQYVHVHNQSSTRSLRDRRMLLGRCQNCGSLRRDCGSCDVWSAPQQQQRRQGEEEEPQRRLYPQDKEQTNAHISARKVNLESEATAAKYGGESDDADSIDVMLDEINAFDPGGRKLRNLQKRAKLLLFGNDHDNDIAVNHLKVDDSDKTQLQQLESSRQASSSSTDLKDETQNEGNTLPHPDVSSSSDDDDSYFIKELVSSQKRFLSSPKKYAFGFEGHRKQRIAARRPRRRHHTTSILESIGQATTLQQPSEHEVHSNGGVHSETPARPKSDNNSQTPSPPPHRSEVATPASKLSFASRDTKDSDDSATKDQEKEQDSRRRSQAAATVPWEDDDYELMEVPPQHIDLNSVAQEQTLDEDGGGDFIQPEGSAEEMPSDVADQTKSVPFYELPAFFDRKAQHLEMTEIPKARQQLARMESLHRQKSKTQDNNSLQTAMERLKEAEDAYQTFVSVLVNQGADQCRIALKKATNRRLLRQNKASMTLKQLEEFRETKLDAREIRFGQLDNDLEGILAECRHFLRLLEDEVEHLYEIQQQHPDDQSEQDENCDDRSFGSIRHDNLLQQDTLDDRTLSPFDPHRHAQIKKRHGITMVYQNGDKIQARKQKATGKRQDRKSTQRQRHQDEIVILRGHATTQTTRSHDDWIVAVNKAEANAAENHWSSQKDGTNNHHGQTLIMHSASTKQKQMTTSSVGRPHHSDGYEGHTLSSSFGLTKECDRSIVGGMQSTSRQLQTRRKSSHDCSVISTKESLPLSPDKENARPSSKRRKTNKKDCSSSQNDPPNTLSAVHADRRVRLERMFSALREKGRSTRNPPVGQERERPRLLLNLHAESSLPPADDVETLCSCITAEYQTSSISCSKSLEKLTDLLHSRSTAILGAMPCIRQTLIAALRSQNGRRILQEVIARGDAVELGVQIKILVATLEFMSNAKETSSRGQAEDSGDIFCGPRSAVFLKVVVDQFVESVLSMFQPAAWGLKRVPASEQIMKHLEYMLSYLSLHVNMVEWTSRCILQELQTQKWRVAESQDFVFLSSVDPALWSIVLDCRQILHVSESSKTRYSALGQNLPRCEVDAIWCTLAFVAASEQKISENGVFAWKLLADILLRGTLFISDRVSSPNPTQVEECRSEMKHLTDLVPTLASVGLKDSFLINVVRRVSLLGSSPALHGFLVPGVEERDCYYTFKFMANEMKNLLVSEDSSADRPCMPQPKLSLWESLSQPPDTYPVESRFLFPTSDLYRHCLAFVCAWITHLPAKKVRLNSYTKKTKICWLEQMKQLSVNVTASHSEADPFQHAFSVQENDNKTQETHNASFLEFAAFFEVISSVSLRIRPGTKGFIPTTDATQLAKELWELLSDRGMKERFHMIARKTETHCDFLCDIFLVRVSAKVFSFVMIFIAGLNPFSPTDDVGTALSGFCGSEVDSRALDFLSGALLTCLDFSSHYHGSLEHMGFVLCCLGTLIHKLKRVAWSAETEQWQVSTALAFLRSCWGKFLPVFCRSFRLSQHERSDPLREQTLSLLLSVFYGLIPKSLESTSTALASVPTVVETPVENGGGDDDDEWICELDESALAVLADSCEDQNERNKLCSVVKMMLDALDEAKPSTRYDINTSRPKSDSLTTQARIAVSRKSWMVCACLAKLTLLSRDEAVGDLVFGLLSFSRLWDCKEQDKVYFKRCCFSYLSELFRIEKTQSFNHLAKHVEAVCLGVFSMSLETELLRKLPSITLAVSDVVEDRNDKARGEYLRLKEFRRSGKLASLLERSVTHQAICKALLRWLRECSPSGADAYDSDSMEQIDHDMKTKPLDIRPSMEGTLFNRFRILRGVISTASCSGQSLAFQQLGNILTQSAWEMLCMLNSIGHVNAVNDKKLKETITCFAEFHAALVAWYLLQASDTRITSPDFRKIVHNLYVAPILRCSSSCPTPAFKEAARRKFDKGTDEVGSWQPQICTNDSPTFSFIDLPMTMISRCRELCLCFAIDLSIGELHKSSFSSFSAMLELCRDDKVARSVATTLGSCETDETMNMSVRSTFANSVDNYMMLLRKEKRFQHRYGMAMAKLARHTLEDVLLPRLTRPRLRGADRLAPLRLLRHMLEVDDDDSDKKSSSVEKFDLKLMCSMFRSIATSLCSILSEPRVHVDSLFTVLLCLKSSVSLPARKIEPNAIGWFLDWCVSIADRIENDPSDQEACCAYIVVLARFFRRVLKLMQDTALDGLYHFRLGVRRKSLESNFCCVGYWADLELEVSTLEVQLGLFNSTAAASISNIYSKANACGEVSLDEFVPDDEMKRIALLSILELGRAIPDERS
ncbi:hypothetical protein ACA910_000221 [Epithemia clementina (nom. ined.)]